VEDSVRYQILRTLESNPEISQRNLARELGLSLGKTNYCLRAVIDKGWVKARNFKNSNNKSAYLYQLTPQGVAAKARITKRFLARKVEEYQALEQEIADLRAEVETRARKPAAE
jgi:EPS-associated MarR family transcriptional regulator